jgi:hypothetical protein
VFIEGEGDPEELRTKVAGRLPSFMLSRAYHFWSELLHNANGKLDRKAMVGSLKPTVSNTFLENPLTEEGYRYVVDYLGKRHKSSLGQQKIDFVTQILKFEGLQQFR